MPSPSKFVLVSGLVITGGLFYGGAWFASGLTSSEGSSFKYERPVREMPLLAPVPEFNRHVIEQVQSISSSILASSQKETLQRNVASAENASEKTHVTNSKDVMPLRVTISGVRNANGKVLVLIFDNQPAYDAYDYDQAVGFAEIAATTEDISFTFKDLISGPYAVTLFHDENGNYDLDMQDGYPIEGYGTSGAENAYDELSFQQAAVNPGDISVQMYYF